MTSNNLTAFSFDSRPVRTVMQDSEPWFVAADVCEILEHSNSRMALSRLDAEEKGVRTVYTPGGDQKMAVISESGLYSLVLTSRKPEAKRFKKWVTAEVLPQIRKTGAYAASAPAVDLTDPAALRSILLGYTEKVIELQATIAHQAPKVAACDVLSEADGDRGIRDAAKNLGVPERALIEMLIGKGWLFRPTKSDGSPGELRPAAMVVTRGFCRMVPVLVRRDGTDKTRDHLRITNAGITRLAALVIKWGMRAGVSARKLSTRNALN